MVSASFRAKASCVCQVWGLGFRTPPFFPAFFPAFLPTMNQLSRVLNLSVTSSYIVSHHQCHIIIHSVTSFFPTMNQLSRALNLNPKP